MLGGGGGCTQSGSTLYCRTLRVLLGCTSVWRKLQYGVAQSLQHCIARPPQLGYKVTPEVLHTSGEGGIDGGRERERERQAVRERVSE